MAEAETLVEEYFKGKAFFRVHNEDRNNTELIYEVSAVILNKAKKNHPDGDIKKLLFEIKNVEVVNLVCQNDEITR